MKKLAKKICIFLTPFLIALLLFYTLEPFNWFGLRHDAVYSTKPLSAMREVINGRPENIILGDSRLANLNLDYIEELTGDRYVMLGFGGAQLGECMELFWFATRHTQLKKVVFEASFYFSKGALGVNKGRIPEIEKQATNLYAFTMWTDYWLLALEQGKRLGQTAISGLLRRPDLLPSPEEDPTSLIHQEVPFDEPGERYRLGLEKYASEQIYPLCTDYTVDDSLWLMLDEIIDYCNANDIELVFVIPPMHVSLFTIVTEPLGIDSYRDRIRDFLVERVPVIDFEFISEFNSNDDNFYDGFHLRNEMKRVLIEFIFGSRESEAVVRTSPTN